MGTYRYWQDSYAREATWGAETGGISNVIPNAAATTYLFGVMSKKSTHPSPKTKMNYAPVPVNALEVSAGELWKSVFESTGVYSITMQNGMLLQAVLGKSATAGGGPYTHTITPSAATAGVLSRLPSFTIQHEKEGTATDWATQFLGCKVSHLQLSCSFEQPLVALVTWLAKKAAKVNFMLTDDPALPATANAAGYYFSNLTRTWDQGGANTAINGLIEMQLDIDPNLRPVYAATTEAGVFTGQWLNDILEVGRRRYDLTMTLTPESSSMWEELVTASNTKDMRFKWTRSATDYIQADLLDCNVTGHELITPQADPMEGEIVQVTIEPRALSFTVVDSIAGGAYGE